MTLTAREFVDTWRAGAPAHDLQEPARGRAHFIDLCRLLDVPGPGDGTEGYGFERPVPATTGRPVRVDVWRDGCFAWEVVRAGGDLAARLRWLRQALPPGRPPLLVATDGLVIQVQAHVTGAAPRGWRVGLQDLTQPEAPRLLRALWLDPQRLVRGDDPLDARLALAGGLRLRPLTDRVVVRPADPSTPDTGGIVIPDTASGKPFPDDAPVQGVANPGGAPTWWDEVLGDVNRGRAHPPAPPFDAPGPPPLPPRVSVPDARSDPFFAGPGSHGAPPPASDALGLPPGVPRAPSFTPLPEVSPETSPFWPRSSPEAAGAEAPDAGAAPREDALADRTAPVPTEDPLLQDPRNVPVWFATNRTAVPPDQRDPADPCSAFGNGRSAVVRHGRLIVNVPEGHRPEKTWWGSLLRFTLGQRDALRAVKLEEQTPEAFWAGLGQAMRERDEGEPPQALFYLHGYGNGFADAALRTAQLSYDLRIRPAVFFAWPSQGGVLDYAADVEAMDGSRRAIRAFLHELDRLALAAGTRVQVIAHSMGNRALLGALEALAEGGGPWAVEHIVFAAPDAEPQFFAEEVAAARRLPGRKTLYASNRDLALVVSRWVNARGRAGLLPPATVVPGVDTIDASDVDRTFMGHGYVADARAMITDLKLLFTAGLDPGQRVGLDRVGEGPAAYWRLR